MSLEIIVLIMVLTFFRKKLRYSIAIWGLYWRNLGVSTSMYRYFYMLAFLYCCFLLAVFGAYLVGGSNHSEK